MTVAGVIVNADDWGAFPRTTDPIDRCLREGTVSSVSAMVHMPDSRRAAEIALERGVDCGLHLNLTLPLQGPGVPSRVRERQARAVGLLTSDRRGAVRSVLSAGAALAISDAVRDQAEAFAALYGRPPTRLDGHEHVHLRLSVMRAPGLRDLRAVVRAPWEPELDGPTVRTGLRTRAQRAQAAARRAALGRAHLLPVVNRSVLETLPELGGEEHRADRVVAAAAHGPVEVVCHPSDPAEAAALAGEAHRRFLRRVRVIRWADVVADAGR